MTQAIAYQQEINMLKTAIIEQYQPNKIILFGSAARGDLRSGSDIDMAIIKPSSKKRYHRTVEILQLVKHLPRTLPFEPIMFTPEEFATGQQQQHYLIRQIMLDGKVLYEA